MKKCSSCGSECEDNVKFCTSCGAAFPAEPDFFVSEEPKKNTAYGGKQLLVKTLSSSTMALILVIAFTLALVGCVCSAMLVPVTLNKYASDIATLIGTYGQELIGDLPSDTVDSINQALSEGFSANIGAAISGELFTIITAAALWIIYISAKNKNKPCCSSTGFEIIRVLKIIGLVARCLLFAVLALVLVLVSSALEENGLGDYSALPLAVIAGVGVIFIFVLFFYLGVIRTLKTLSLVAEGEKCKIRVSGYSAFIYSFCGIIKVILAVVMLIISNGEGIALVTAAICLFSAISNWTSGKYIRSCKKLKLG